MNKVDFSDINKFITSIGLLLIIVALLLPWYVNNYFEVLAVDNETLKTLTETSRKTIVEQQYFVNWFFTSLKCIMFWFILIGIILMIIGLWRWNDRQKVLNGIQDEEWRLKKQQGISDDEKKDILEHELEQQEEDSKSTPQQDDEPKVKHKDLKSKNLIIRKYLAIEDLIYFKLAQNYTVNYRPKQNIRIINNNYDIILESKDNNKRADLIFEVKYFRTKAPKSHYVKIMQRFLLAISEYEEVMRRKGTIPVLIFVYESEELLESNKNLESQIMQFAQENNIKDFRFIEVLDDALESISADKLITR